MASDKKDEKKSTITVMGPRERAYEAAKIEEKVYFEPKISDD